MLINLINQNTRDGKKMIAFLIDPGKTDNDHLKAMVLHATENMVDFFLIGGSIIHTKIDSTLQFIKELTHLPVFLFPGNLMQLSEFADGILFLSLISGRNPELLIGNHVSSAYFLKKSGLEIIPTGYILIENGKSTSVSYMSNTTPIPAEKTEIIVSTALAGELLGLQMIYLEAGSGAKKPVDAKIIHSVKKEISIPVIVGGGIKTIEQVKDICQAGADIIVIGNSLETNLKLIKPFIEHVHSY